MWLNAIIRSHALFFLDYTGQWCVVGGLFLVIFVGVECILLFFAYLFPFVLFSFRFLGDVAEISFCVCILGGVLIVYLVVFLLQADLAAFGLIVVG